VTESLQKTRAIRDLDGAVIPTRLDLGETYTTRGIVERLKHEQIHQLFVRHATSDWGECYEEDAQENEEALVLGNRVMSMYSFEGERIYVITEADRSSTCILFGFEY
jgi:hypothetical protein